MCGACRLLNDEVVYNVPHLLNYHGVFFSVFQCDAFGREVEATRWLDGAVEETGERARDRRLFFLWLLFINYSGTCLFRTIR